MTFFRGGGFSFASEAIIWSGPTAAEPARVRVCLPGLAASDCSFVSSFTAFFGLPLVFGTSISPSIFVLSAVLFPRVFCFGAEKSVSGLLLSFCDMSFFWRFFTVSEDFWDSFAAECFESVSETGVFFATGASKGVTLILRLVAVRIGASLGSLADTFSVAATGTAVSSVVISGSALARRVVFVVATPARLGGLFMSSGAFVAAALARVTLFTGEVGILDAESLLRKIVVALARRYWKPGNADGILNDDERRATTNIRL